MTGLGLDFRPKPSRGIQISRGATAEISGNAISDNWYTGPSETTACGLLFYQAAGVRQRANVFSGNQADLCNAGRGGGGSDSAS